MGSTDARIPGEQHFGGHHQPFRGAPKVVPEGEQVLPLPPWIRLCSHPETLPVPPPSSPPPHQTAPQCVTVSRSPVFVSSALQLDMPEKADRHRQSTRASTAGIGVSITVRRTAAGTRNKLHQTHTLLPGLFTVLSRSVSPPPGNVYLKPPLAMLTLPDLTAPLFNSAPMAQGKGDFLCFQPGFRERKVKNS